MKLQFWRLKIGDMSPNRREKASFLVKTSSLFNGFGAYAKIDFYLLCACISKNIFNLPSKYPPMYFLMSSTS